MLHFDDTHTRWSHPLAVLALRVFPIILAAGLFSRGLVQRQRDRATDRRRAQLQTDDDRQRLVFAKLACTHCHRPRRRSRRHGVVKAAAPRDHGAFKPVRRGGERMLDVRDRDVRKQPRTRDIRRRVDVEDELSRVRQRERPRASASRADFALLRQRGWGAGCPQ